MKLWRLCIPADKRPDERWDMLHEFAKMMRAPGTRALMAGTPRMITAFVAMGNKITAGELDDAWRFEYGDPEKMMMGPPPLGCDVVKTDQNVDALARYCGANKEALVNLMEQCYGVRYRELRLPETEAALAQVKELNECLLKAQALAEGLSESLNRLRV